MWLSAALSRFGIAVEGGPLGTNLPQTPEFLVLNEGLCCWCRVLVHAILSR